jgi:glucose/mannose-6-phosphate isomerase
MNKKRQKDFLKFLVDFPSQIKKAKTMVEEILPLSIDAESIQSIVLLGMGGSAIAGNIFAGYAGSQLRVPFLVNRNYSIPAFVDENTLVIASSYSGNTEETLSAVSQALERKAKLLVISSGGKLGEIAAKNSLPWIRLPEGYPPRQAFGYSFFALLHLMDEMNFVKPDKKELSESIKVAEHILQKQHPDHGETKHIAYEIAQGFYKKVPVIYAGAEWMHPVAVRIQNQLHENGKSLAFSNVLPEMNHNEIVGWELNNDLTKQFSILFLRDQHEHPRIKKRIEITHSIISKYCDTVIELYPEGETKLARIISMIYLGDWISYYLSILYDKDPMAIKNIDYLKKELSKLKENV